MNIKTILIFIAVMIGVLAGVGGLLYQFGQAGEKPVEDIAGEMRYKKGEGSVTLVEFSDFQCPACLSVQAPLKQILNKYEGKVQFVYRHFPLSSIHKNAQMAAQASEAAHQQNKFWEMHDKLFETQASWQGIGDPREVFIGYAKELGLDEAKFVNDLESQSTKDVVNQDLLATTRYRLTGTPTFFLNGSKVEFAQIETKLSELTK
jgi:protein-disulfide isomerase